MPVGVQRQMPGEFVCGKLWEVAQLVYIDKVLTVPVETSSVGGLAVGRGFSAVEPPFFALLRVVPKLGAR